MRSPDAVRFDPLAGRRGFKIVQNLLAQIDHLLSILGRNSGNYLVYTAIKFGN